MDFDFTEKNRKKIIDELKKRKALLNCPRCGHNEFALADGLSVVALQGNLKSISIGGTGMPTVIAVCKNCGFLSQHALGVLNIKDSNKKTEDTKQNDEVEE